LNQNLLGVKMLKSCICILVSTLLFTPLLLSTHAGEKDALREDKITDSDRSHWAFRPLVQPKVPAVKSKVRNPIDAFILAKLETKQMQPMPEAGRATLIRRLCMDLTGLPPTPAQVDAFVNDAAADAYEKLVDRLLASNAYGERWAQHWLDLARFAESDGYEHDIVRKDAWKYRDWVIDALNKDMPYDEFVRLQIAGDELKPDKSGTHVATGFLMSGPDMPDVNLEAERRHVLLNEMTSTVGSVFMAMTLECAQCHNHKYDAISQADFYRLRAIFANTLPKLGKKQHAMTVTEPGPKAPETHFMIRGDFQRPGPMLEPGFVRVANPTNKSIPKVTEAKSSMRRAALAQWLTQPDHPLTRRVIVNRVWLHHFGVGLSNTPSDFGVMGEEPSHPELLDWLAAELPRMNWSLKKLHRLIVTSATYRQASRPGDPAWSDEVKQQAIERWKVAKANDPKNRLLSRMNRTRLDGETIRDAMLVAAQQLSPRKGGPGVRPALPKEIVATLLKDQWIESPDEEDHRRRSVYIFARRNLRFPNFEAFDRPDGNASCALRGKSTTAPQALMLLNSTFSSQMANAVAANATKAHEGVDEQIAYCYRAILLRSPNDGEMRTSRVFLREQSLADFCLALFNVNEFVYVD
jgi:hypothetical protein